MKKLYVVVLLAVSFGMHSQNIYFPDPVLKQKLLTPDPDFIILDIFDMPLVIDANNNGEISVSEAANVGRLLFSDASGITNLTGLHKFIYLTHLSLDTSTMADLDLSIMPSLTHIYVRGTAVQTLNMTGLNLESVGITGTSVTSLDFSAMNAITYLQIWNTPISSLDVANMPLLKTLYVEKTNVATLDLSNKQYLDQALVYENNLSSINVQNCPLLRQLNVNDNQLTSLDVSTNLLLESLRCSTNNLTVLDVTNNLKLKGLVCENNQLTTLDVSNKYSITNLVVKANPLKQLFIKNGKYYQFLDLYQIPTLTYICADENNVAAYKEDLEGNFVCEINSYCSFEPGGITYTINGTARLDANNNGCDAADTVVKNLKFSITNGTQSGNIIPDASGNYSFPVSAGTHTIAPVLENPSYFNVSPASVSVTFPDQTSPQTQNFCITPNGTHNDLEVSLIATVPARPGFDAAYRLIYKNKGNTVQSGSVAMTFNDALTDFVSSTVAPIQGSNTLTWNYVNLHPFETRVIDVVLNINTPMETPAVNGGDLLDYHAFVLGTGTEETPEDNQALLKQTVVNSFDPNDKTCSEGATITPDMAGKYVHYTIRFENTGTFAAQNIVVKDMIDTAKFDVASLVPLNGSHLFQTRITNTNKVEFIFENINLPFDDATNDGFVTFKIKTLPTLVLGDTFSNTASIYFDYNFPIVTDPAVTAVQMLGVGNFGNDSLFTVYPNPASDFLNIGNKTGAELKSVSVYNMLGQLVLAVPNANGLQRVDVSRLSSGQYIVTVASGRGKASIPFIKQ